MDRTLLQYLLKLRETESITRAAEELLLSRQTLSGHIAKCEKEVGANLFTRSREGVKLTDAGRLLCDFAEREEARRREGELDFAETIAKIKSVEEHARVTFAFPVNMLSKGSVTKIAEAGDGSNGYLLEMVDVSQPSWRDVKSGRFDVIMSRRLPPKGNPEIVGTPIFSQSAYLLVSESSPLSQLDEVDFRMDLQKKTLLCMFDHLVSELGLYASRQRLALQKVSPNLMIVESLILRNADTICVIPEMTASLFESECGGVVCVPLTNFPISLDAYLVHRRNPPSSVARFLADMKLE